MDEPPHWQDWIAAHGPQLVLYARRWTFDHAQAEDWVQDAFVRFWRTRDRVHDPLAYLYQCVRSAAIDGARSQQSRRDRESAVARSETFPALFVQDLENAERQGRLEIALAQLPSEQAEVIALKIWSGLTFAQIAAVTGCPASAAASRYRYALQHLRRILAEAVL